jgi:penicillin-binding protein 1B
VVVLGVLLGATFAWMVWPFWQLSAQLASASSVHPSRVYGAPLELTVDRFTRPSAIRSELEYLGYRATSGAPGLGEFFQDGNSLTIGLRPFPSPEGRDPGGVLEVTFSGRRIVSLTLRGAGVRSAALDPPVLASFLGSGMRDKIAVPLADVPENLIHAVLAAEDASFFRHAGLSVSGIVRAAWVNLRGGGVSQGGSTLTQQLVKNLFLTHERTWARKLREVALAVLVDLRYDKQAILETYLNEIYWGTDGSVNLMGVGSAAWGYFGKTPAELTLCESATLAAIIRSPGRYSPQRHPDRVVERRNAILDRMQELGWLSDDRLRSAREEPLCYAPRQVPIRKAPYFAEFAADEAVRRFGVDPRTTPGLALLSTVDRQAQEAANGAVDWGLKALEEGWESGSQSSQPLQAALLSVDPRTGSIRAYVGGRDFAASQFDRVRSARRQAGSAFKPVVYAAAFEAGTATPVTLVEDSPITVVLAGRRWSPKNYDEEFRGWVTTRTALERSLNIPTVRIALATRLPRVVETARALGVTTELKAFPALALGAFEVTPIDLTSVFATLAAGGVKREVHGLAAVLDPAGIPIEGAVLEEPSRALGEEASYLVTSVLQGVFDRGTARSVRSQGIEDKLAGKTGTTNDRRDSWFAGYSPDQATLVWVGYDDSSPTRLSGARAALPIWARYTLKVRPAGGYPVFEMPRGMTTAVIDPVSGELATQECPNVITEVFAAGDRPEGLCRLHSSWRDWSPGRQPREVEAEGEREKKRFRWLRRLFGRESGG